MNIEITLTEFLYEETKKKLKIEPASIHDRNVKITIIDGEKNHASVIEIDLADLRSALAKIAL